MIVVLLNATIGTATEIEAERTISALTTLEEPPATVIRDGEPKQLLASGVVPGDVILLHRGQYIPADARLLEVNEFSVAESVLTGESVPIRKQARTLPLDVALPDRVNMVYRGTIVTGGSAVGVVIDTGSQTEIGRIQSLITETLRPATPMERQLDTLGHQLVIACLAITGGVLVIGLLRGYGIAEMIRTAVSLAIAAVPEGLPTVATSTLAYGMLRLRKQNIVVRNLNAVEALGDIQILCLDKTGTLTADHMSVAEVITGRANTLAKLAVLCSEAEYAEYDGLPIFRGSSTETALLEFARKCGIDIEQLRRQWPVLSMQHRSETRNVMSTLHAQDGRQLLAMKGSPAEVIEQCSWRESNNGERMLLSPEDRERILAENWRMASAGQRVLGVAYAESNGSTSDGASGADLDELIWVGLVGLADPPRQESPATLLALHRAGIETRMITGDQQHTAMALARMVGLNGSNGEPAILDFSKLDPTTGTAIDKIQHTDIFSRVNPGNKLAIVQALQRNGQIVGMTGDGINDGPALKRADIGIAMGQTGAETAREVADVILLDDNLEAIITAIREGRTIHENIRKAVHYITATNLSEIMTVATSLAIGLGQPLSPRQLLWINVLSDVFPGLALAVEPPAPDVLQRPPNDPRSSVITGSDYIHLSRKSAVLAGTAMAAYTWGVSRFGLGPKASSMAFLTLTSAQLLHTLNERFPDGRNSGTAANPYIVMAIGGGLAIEIAAIALPPLRSLLGLAPLGLMDIGICGVCAICSLFVNRTSRAMAIQNTKTFGLLAPAHQS